MEAKWGGYVLHARNDTTIGQARMSHPYFSVNSALELVAIPDLGVQVRLSGFSVDL